MSKSTYQMSIPLTIVSAIVLIYAVEEITKEATMGLIKGQVDLWGSIVTGLVFIFSYSFSIFVLARRTIKSKDNPTSKEFVGSAIAVITFAVFSLVALTQGTTGTEYSLMYRYLPGYIPDLVLYSFFYIFLRLVRMDDIYTIIFFGVMIFTSICQIPLVQSTFPSLFYLYQWLQYVPNTAASTGTIMCAGAGAVILGLRAIARKEPGLIEVEKA